MPTRKALAVVAVAITAAVCAGTSDLLPAQTRKQSANALSNWRPFNNPDGIRYVGSLVCARCHPSQAATQTATPMAHALAGVEDCRILRAHPRLTFTDGRYSYLIAREGDRSTYTVSDGGNSISVEVLYCFGSGIAGQTFVFRHNGAFYESRVSYYTEGSKLDITIEHPRGEPPSLENALGRRMTEEAAQACFRCHATAVPGAARLHQERPTPGITCESCHGPGERHIAAVTAKRSRDLQIFNPAKLDGLELSQEFCGACHQSFETVLQLPDLGGINNIRFQPYRMLGSRGHLTNDRRMSCTACHNPHERARSDAASYDSNCLSCHLKTAKEKKTALRSAAACPVSTQQCVTCHMPKVHLPDMHFKFTDHRIRIVRPNEPVPR
jgi:hypothetical protein